jgi:single-stranded DNA-specific DHH superfamily exonuclease
MEKTKQEIKESLDEIKSKDKVALVFHDDLDGYSSAVMIYNYLESRGIKEIKTSSFILSKSDLKEILVSIEANVVIVMDIAPNLICQDFPRICETKKVIYIDHHKKDIDISPQVFEYRQKEGYIPAARMVFEILNKPRVDEWLAIAGILADEGDKYPENEKIISSFLKREALDLKFYKEIAYQLSNFIAYFKNNTESAFSILRDIKNYTEVKKISKYSEPIEEEIQKWVKTFKTDRENIGGLDFFYFLPKYSVRAAVINRLAVEFPEAILIFAGPSGENISVSTRNQSGKINMINLLKKAVEGIENASSGGHPAASGANFPASGLNRFKENLAKMDVQEFLIKK